MSRTIHYEGAEIIGRTDFEPSETVFEEPLHPTEANLPVPDELLHPIDEILPAQEVGTIKVDNEEFVLAALTFSISMGQIAPETALKMWNSWYPDSHMEPWQLPQPEVGIKSKTR